MARERSDAASPRRAAGGTSFQTMFAQNLTIFLALAAVAAFAAATGTAAADHNKEVRSVEIVDTVDRDDDGFLSSFTIEVDADTYLGGHEGTAGDPAFEIRFSMYSQPTSVFQHEAKLERENYGTFRYEFTTEQLLDAGGQDVNTGEPEVLVAPYLLKGIRVTMYELDPHPLHTEPAIKYHINDQLDDADEYPDDDEPLFGLETESEDRAAHVVVTSNPSGATVSVDGEERGTTQWTGSFAEDIAKRQGATTITVEKEGYSPKTKNLKLSPPQQLDFTLEKDMKPVVVTSSPEGATVEVDGETVGSTPWSGERWTGESVDITVDKEGYTPESFSDVRPEASVHASLDAETDYTDTQSGGSFDDPQQDDTDSDYTNLSGTDAGSSLDSGSSTGSGSLSGGGTGSLATGGLGGLDDSTDLATSDPIGDVGSLTAAIPELDLDGVFAVNFTHGPQNARAGQTLFFDGSASYSLSGQIQSYAWDFGDGTTATGETTHHGYDESGTYTVELTATNDQGDEVTETRTVRIRNVAPDPVVGVSPLDIAAGDTVTFDASGSSDDGTIARYEWSFADGESATGATHNRTFADSGRYGYTLTVTDDDGETASREGEITVRAEQSDEASGGLLDRLGDLVGSLF